MKAAIANDGWLAAVCVCVFVAIVADQSTRAADWPMWRCDAGRTGVCEERLSDTLYPQWTRKLAPQVPAWKDETSMQFDRGYRPVVSGKLMFVGSTVDHTVRAFDTETGRQRWRYFCEGHVRVAPVAYEGNVYVASDDGCLYCLGASDGRLRWKFRGGPSDRRLIGNGHPISTWPARGGPVAADGKVYFAVGVWPFMGTFVYALDTRRGTVEWINDSTSFTFRRMPHYGSAAFSGLSPQGHLAVAGDVLIVPGSRMNPALFDRNTGEFLAYAEGTGPAVAAQGDFAFAGGSIFDVASGDSVRLDRAGRFEIGVFADDFWFTPAGILDSTAIRTKRTTVDVPHGNPDMKMDVHVGRVKQLRSLRITPWLLAGTRLVGSRGGDIQLLDVSDKSKDPEAVWHGNVDGSPCDVLAADGKLFVVTIEGAIHCFGPKETEPTVLEIPKPEQPRSSAWDSRARDMLRDARVSDGYAIVHGLKDGGLVESLLTQSRLYVIAVDRDARKVDALRDRLDKAALYGTRAVALVDETKSIEFAPYLASLILSEDPKAAGFEQVAVDNWAEPLRPYGGTACLPMSTVLHARLIEWAEGNETTGFEVKRSGEYVLLVRNGPLPDSAPWQGQNADACNTRCSRDRRVMAPLGVLWFGNALSNSLVLPRHGEGPVEQVAGGRMFIEGPDSISATDVYTGRLLWTRVFAGLGKYYVQTKHQLGAHAIGSNFFAVADAVYVADGKSCHMLDPSSGETLREMKLPDGSDWLFLLVYDDLLIAGAQPTVAAAGSGDGIRYNTPASSKKLVVMNRRDGKILWTHTAQKSFGHFAICAGGGKVFCIDRTSPESLNIMARRGQAPTGTPRIYALEAMTGKVVWETGSGVGAQLTYSEEHDILLSGAAMRGETGEVLWYNPTAKSSDGTEERDLLWNGKWGLMLRGTTIFPQGNRAFDLLTGNQRTWTDPRGNPREWTYPRSHGCGPKAAGEHLLTFRSGCAGFVDLKHDSGTGNLGGFRSGCTPNLIVADGVLSAPDYTRTCGCTYQNRSSLALVHMPEAEYWARGAAHTPGRVGFNLGAPGDRRDPAGTLWRAVPNIPDRMARDKTLWWGNPAAVDQHYVAKALVETVPEQPRGFYHHASRVEADGPWKWIAGSGLTGLRTAKVPLVRIDIEKPFTVRLCFAETEHTRPGSRVFSVALDGREILKDFDVFRESGGQLRAVVREFENVIYSGRRASELPAIDLTFKAKAGEPVIGGIEIVQSAQ